MKKIIAIFAFVLFISASVFAESAITGGNMFITGSSSGEEGQNATLTGSNFSAQSYLGGFYSPWYDICGASIYECKLGQTFYVPRQSQITVGGCIGSCYQFVSGTFTINGNTYQNVYYRGYFNFERVPFLIPRIYKRKGSVVFRKPFSLQGRLKVCEINDYNAPCPADKILFDDDIKGHGTLTVRMEVKIFDNLTVSFPYLMQKSFNYQFES